MRIQITALLAVAAFALAACGGDEETPAAAAADGPDASTRQAMADFAECMRENGIDFPDPGSGEAAARCGSTAARQKMREAEEACAELRAKIKPPELSDEQQGGVQGGRARPRALHARARHRELPRPAVQRGRRGRDQARAGRRRSTSTIPDFQAAQEALRGRAAADARGGGAVSRALIAGGGAVAAALVVAGAVALSGGDGAPSAAAAAARRSARPRRSSAATWSSATRSTARSATPTTPVLVAGRGGTLTRLRDPGAVVRRGESLYSVDGRAAAWLLYGALPAWRDFTPGMEDGEDVRQLERNLRALGADPDGDLTVDDEWDWATTAAVERFQEERGMDGTGTLARGAGALPARPVADRRGVAGVGQVVRPGQQIGRISSTRREVTVDLDATRQSLAREGDAVTVELPTGGRRAAASPTSARSPTRRPRKGGDATIPVTIALRGKAARGSGLDQAPVDVGFEVERRGGRARPCRSRRCSRARAAASRCSSRARGGSSRSSPACTPTTSSRSRAGWPRATTVVTAR